LCCGYLLFPFDEREIGVTDATTAVMSLRNFSNPPMPDHLIAQQTGLDLGTVQQTIREAEATVDLPTVADPTVSDVADVARLTDLTNADAQQLDKNIRAAAVAMQDAHDVFVNRWEELKNLLSEAKSIEKSYLAALGYKSWSAYLVDAVGLTATNISERKICAEFLRSEKLSWRAIGQILGVSHEQARQDAGHVSSGLTAGLDGKGYPTVIHNEDEDEDEDAEPDDLAGASPPVLKRMVNRARAKAEDRIKAAQTAFDAAMVNQWKEGQILQAVEDQLPPGGYLPWVASNYNGRTVAAQRSKDLFNKYPSVSRLVGGQPAIRKMAAAASQPEPESQKKKRKEPWSPPGWVSVSRKFEFHLSRLMNHHTALLDNFDYRENADDAGLGDLTRRAARP
jgi:hypothetical protein